MSYESFDSDLVELFEYKVADMLAGKMPRGGKAALRDLRDYLLTAQLDSALLRRMRQTDKAWREFQKTGQPSPTSAAAISLPPSPASASSADPSSFDLSSLLEGLTDSGLNLESGAQKAPLQGSARLQEATDPIAQAAGSDNRNEWDVLRNLQSALFYADLYQRAQQKAQQWVSDHQPTLRLALALTVALQQAFPNHHLPLLDLPYRELRHPERAAQTLSILCQHLADPLSALPNNVQRVKAALRGLLSSTMPQSVLGLKAFKDEEKDQQQLEHTLNKLLSYSGQDGTIAASTAQPILQQAVQQLTQFLETILPRSLGGRGPEMALLGGLLYARGQAIRLTQPDDTSLSLAIHLTGGEQTQWRGAGLRWRRLAQEEGWEITITNPQEGDNFVRLTAAQPLAESRLMGEKLSLALLGDDLALERFPTQHTDLLPLVQEAHLTAALLESEQHYATLRLARAVAMYLRSGSIAPEKVSPASAAAYATVPAATLLAFARQGAQTLLKAAPQADPTQLTQAFAHALVATNAAPETTQALLDLLLLPNQQLDLPMLSDYGAPTVSQPLTHAVLPFRGEPLGARVMTYALTLRNDIAGQLSAIVPGIPSAPVGDLLALPTPNGSIIVTRLGERLAVGFQPKLPHPAEESGPVLDI